MKKVCPFTRDRSQPFLVTERPLLGQQLILSDEDKQLIKNKIKENKQKRLKVNDSSNSCDSQTFSSHFLSLNKHLRSLIASPSPQQPWLVSTSQLQSLLSLVQSRYVITFCMQNTFQSNAVCFDCSADEPNRLPFIRISHPPNRTDLSPDANPLKQIFSFENLNHIYRSEMCDQWSTERTDLTCASFIKPDTVSKLTAIEIKRLNELSIAFMKVKSESVRIPSNYWQYSDILRLTDQAVRRIIEMSKKIECYRSLCQMDQAALMRTACTQMIMLRSVCNWNEDRNYWTIVKVTRLAMTTVSDSCVR